MPMGANKVAIKNRIRSIDSTMKITKAMQLIAASKYQRQKERMRKNKEYAMHLKGILDEILSSLNNCDHPFLVENSGKPSCTIVFTSDMGMCGGYNANVFKLLQSENELNEEYIVVGQRGVSWIKNKGYNVIHTLTQVDDDNYSAMASLAEMVLEKYLNQEISKIQIIYTEFINPLRFEPKKVTLLPVEKGQEESHADTIFEPSDEVILNDLIPMSIKSLIYSYYLETKTSEQASRRTSMETATDNAQELRDTLELEYNQARQAAITQEITEIVGGANAL